ncbi:MAG: U32 family peptidase [Firmicutes bacterium]|nr:U32 family peptidase [Bacillota bacterium]
MNNIEILAPVGSIEALHAAVENGANAVYLGGKLFNARQYASNFDNKQLEEGVRYAHSKNVRVYVTVNILLSDNELKKVIDYILFLYNIDVDALIVQDVGLVRIIKELLPDFEIHSSTQMTINNYMGVKFLEDIDFQRVVLARELSVEEIKDIDEKTDLELEGFVHGALCISYSGQCLMSSIIGGRSGNRGRCAQPCRMAYTAVKFHNGKPINEKFSEKYLLSPKDLNTIGYLEQIIDSGLTSLKIEGRMKRPEYVAVIVSSYKKALESIMVGKDNSGVTEKDKKDILQIFNRGFTKGFIMDEKGESYISYDKPNNRGIYIGDVIKSDKKYTYISLKDDVRQGDGIEIHTLNGKNEGLILNKIYKRTALVNQGLAGETIAINKINGISSKLKVYKTSDTELLERAQKTYNNRENKINIPIFMAIDVTIGKPIKLYIGDSKNHINIESEELVEKARKVSLSYEKINEQMSKLGNTPFILDKIDIKLDNDAMVSISVLNKLRRKAVELLIKKREKINNRRTIKISDLHDRVDKLFDYSSDVIKNGSNRSKKISVSISRFEQFKNLDMGKLDRIYLPLMDNLNSIIKSVKEYDKEVYLDLDRIISNKDFETINNKISNIDIHLIDGFKVGNLGVLKYVRDNFNKKIHGDIGLNIFNTSTLKMFREYGMNSGTLSPELRMEQLKEICSYDIMESEALVYGYLPLMIMKHCPFSIAKKCDLKGDCEKCNFAQGFGLKDRKGIIFRAERTGETSIIYNSQPIMVVEHLKEIYENGASLLRLDFTFENEEIPEIQNIYYDFSKGHISIKEAKEFVNKYKSNLANGITKGHYFRGVL